MGLGAGSGAGAAARDGDGAPAGGRLHVVFGDQLQHDAPALDDLDPARDTVLMMEVAAESAEPASHVQRTVLFLSAMRHYAAWLRARGLRVRYVTLDDPANTGTFAGEIARAVGEVRPAVVSCVRPGEWRVLETVREAAVGGGVGGGAGFEVFEDTHFLTGVEEFAAFAGDKKRVVMETFYRWQRRRLRVLVDEAGEPEGGRWNFDEDNREPLRANSPRRRPPRRFEPDEVVRGVIETVAKVMPGLPGRVEAFGWAVTRAQAMEALRDFVTHRLAHFGPYEDAMAKGEAWVFHSQVSPALNLKLLDPRECVRAAVEAYERGAAPLQSVEAFVRQIIGWREFVRGVYWREGPGYGARNGLQQHGALPEFYWTGNTDMACLRECVGEVLDHAYGHHIQRLMVTGNFALLAGVDPAAVDRWYRGMYADGVDWVTAPNVVGMAMHADGGVVGTKPYAASGKYIARMSDYCDGCRYDVGKRVGENACPFNTLYWDFLLRHRGTFARNTRMAMIVRSAERLPEGERVEITVSARRLRAAPGVECSGDAPAPPSAPVTPSTARADAAGRRRGR